MNQVGYYLHFMQGRLKLRSCYVNCLKVHRHLGQFPNSPCVEPVCMYRADPWWIQMRK